MLVAVDDRAAGLIALADAARGTSAAAVAALHESGIEVAMLSGDNQASAERIAGQLGIDVVVAEVLPEDKSAKVSELQRGGRRVAMVGDGVNDAPALAQADLGVAIGAGTDVAIETADLVLMRSDPLDVPVALTIGKGTQRKERQNLAWAIGYNAIALPIAAGVFEPAYGVMLSPEIAALTMSGFQLPRGREHVVAQAATAACSHRTAGAHGPSALGRYSRPRRPHGEPEIGSRQCACVVSRAPAGTSTLGPHAQQ